MTTIAMEEYELMKDSKYRMYVAAVDKALKNFEYTSEWADLISALGKLNKVLLNYTKFPVIPRRIKISKRLAQCMHPALPAGVHLKALETYDVIFKCMGTNRLSHELFIYSAGLFPLLGHAAMNVRPSLLKVYETHFVPLGERLRPALSGFLSGVLPGLESGSDHFDRTNSLLEKVCEGVGAACFYTCIWQCVRSNSPVRLPAISYVLQHFNRKLSMEDQLYLMGNDIDVMVSGLCAGVQDSSVLVQRSALDLLLVGFPMHNTQLLYTDMVRLVTASLVTILRRDMSLNRRLYSWLLGSEVNTSLLHSDHPLVKNTATDNRNHTERYFELYSIDILVEAIRVILAQSCNEQTIDVKPYRLLTSLLDKSQIGPVILDTILYDVFRALYLTCLNQANLQSNQNGRCVSFTGDLSSLKYGTQFSSRSLLTKQFLNKNCQELMKNANLLFNSLEAYYIWNYLGRAYEVAVQNATKDISSKPGQVNEIGYGKPSVLELCILTEFLLDVIPIETYLDNTSEILPNLFIKIVTLMKDNIKVLNKFQITQSLELCTKLLNKIQPVVVKNITKPEFDINISVESTDTRKSLPSEQSSQESNASVTESTKLDSDLSKSYSGKEVKFGATLEKSKSDSRINENGLGNELNIDLNRERSNSNQMFKKKTSPRIEKKSKSKKSKSSSKLYDLKKDEQTEMQLTDNSSQNNVDVILHDETETFSLSVQAKTENKHIIKCLNIYKKFYITFILSKIIPDVNINTTFEKLRYNVDNRTKDLEALLQKSMECQEEFKPKSHMSYRKVSSTSFNEKPINQTVEYNIAMKLASNILLEFNTFPNLLEQNNDETEFPFWAKVLVVCGCYPQKNNQEIQMIAISTLFEMLSLAKTQNLQNTNNENNTKVVVMGILKNVNVNYLENCTFVIEVMSQILWDLMGVITSQQQMILCVTLLYQIHNIFETKSAVEQVIGRYLIAENLTVEYFKRFTIIWHLGRELDIKIPVTQKSLRNFDRSLLKILDNLQNAEKVNIKLLAETFLVHSLLRNDISRIMNSLFAIFLSPNTARISITYVHIQKSDEKFDSNLADVQKIEDANMKKICAISSVNGTVVYHVTENVTPKPQTKLKSFLFSKTVKKQTGVINMTTSLTDNASVVTRKNKDFKTIEDAPHVDIPAKSNVKLFINPLNAKEIYSDGLVGSYTKLDLNSVDHSSSESLSSSHDINNTSSESNNEISKSFEEYNDINMEYDLSNKDEGFECTSIQSMSEIKSERTSAFSSKYLASYLEQIEPIADGVTDGEYTTTKSEIFPARLSKSQSLEEKGDHEKMDCYEGSGLVHSWSYSMSDSEKISAELEISTTAEEYFKESQIIASEIMEDIINRVYAIREEKRLETENKAKKREINMKARINDKINKPVNIYTIHHHMLLYCDVFDSNLILYAFYTLKNSILTNPRLFISCLATTGLKSSNNSELLHLLGRHRKSIFGLGFSGELNAEYVNFYRGFMFLEVLVSICLNYARSFYPNLDNTKLNEEEIENNLKIQLASLDLLDLIVKNLITLVNENAKGFSCYIGDMLSKCKLQKILLHCLLTSVRNFDNDMTFAEDILMFNHFQLYDSHKKISEHVEAYQIQLLRLMQSLIILEYHVFSQQDNTLNPPVQSPSPNGEQLKYTPTVLIPQQQMFLSAILSALRHQNMKHLHQNWCNMITSCLPYIGQNLKQIALSIIHQLCNNIEKIAESYKSTETNREIASDYAITQLEALTIICHYCLLDSQQPAMQVSSSSTTTGTNPSQIFNNLLNVFLPPISIDGSAQSKQNSDHYQFARKTVLGHMPRIITSVAKLWQTICTTDSDFTSIYGHSKVVKQQLLEFLSPISLHHSANFLAAVAVAWYERRTCITTVKKVLPEPNASQKNLVYLISAIRVIPIDNLVQTVHAVIKSPPPTEGLSSEICLDVPLLELFYCYMQNATGAQLTEAWGSLLALLKESFTLAPPAQFLVLAILHELLTKCCPLNDRKDQKDLQDVTSKLIECVSQVCGSCLEQTTWLRRNLAVKEQEVDIDVISIVSKSGGVNDSSTTQLYSVQAQLVLAEILAPILDICFGSQEKDKVVTILTSLMYNIVPYLRTHTSRNMASFQACSKLLASLSSYQYTRKAWRKDVFDLLLDNNLFQMENSSLKYWKVIIDNLMTHDNTTFRDLMSRVSLTQSGSLSIFSSREQEYEQRAQLLKRLAFVILCSETDQYAKYMPDIQEQLANSLRLSVPGVQAQVFLCFRVILLRMSPLHVTSLWPIIISEMLQVFLQIEQELSTDTEEFSSHIKLLSTLDASWSTNSNNGLHAHGHPHWLQLQLATAKLLDLALILPATALPQFQMYRWAFVGDESIHSSNVHTPTFVPHVTRIANLMDQKFTDSKIETMPTKQNELLLTSNHITQLRDLHSFFKTLSLCSNRHRTDCNGTVSADHSHSDRQHDKQLTAVLEKLDKIIESDFLDKIQR